MYICRVTITSKTIYHDGRDWIIEKRGEDYWSFPLDSEDWAQGLPPALTLEDATLMFSVVPGPSWQKCQGVYLSVFILVLSEKERAVAHAPKNLPG
jgi:hypothetical protein